MSFNCCSTIVTPILTLNFSFNIDLKTKKNEYVLINTNQKRNIKFMYIKRQADNKQ